MFIKEPLRDTSIWNGEMGKVESEPQVTHSEESHKDLLRVSQNMYIACSWFVQKAKTKGKDEKIIKQECLNFLALMIQKLNEESK